MVMVKACLTSQLAPGTMMNFVLLERTVLVANVDGTFYAMDGLCSDAGGNLAFGRLDGHTVICPRHGARFDLRTGEVISQPVIGGGTAKDLRSYRVEVKEGCVNVDV